MARRFAVEWLWLIGCFIGLAIFFAISPDFAPSGDAVEHVGFAVLIAPVAYGAIGVVRLTVWAVTRVVPPRP
jgi:hypothetical protein